jgi:CBS domain-containing protein
MPATEAASSQAGGKTVAELLKVSKATTTQKPSTLIEVTATTKIETALALFEKQKILALPVKVGTATFSAFLTLFDVLHFIAFQPVFSKFHSAPAVLWVLCSKQE